MTDRVGRLVEWVSAPLSVWEVLSSLPKCDLKSLFRHFSLSCSFKPAFNNYKTELWWRDGGRGGGGGEGVHKMSAPSASGLRYRRKIRHLYFHQSSVDEDVNNRNQALSVLTACLCSLVCSWKLATVVGKPSLLFDHEWTMWDAE